MMEQPRVGLEKLLAFKGSGNILSVLEAHTNQKLDVGKANVKEKCESKNRESIVKEELELEYDQEQRDSINDVKGKLKAEYVLKHNNVLKEQLSIAADLGETDVKGQWKLENDRSDDTLNRNNFLKEKLALITGLGSNIVKRQWESEIDQSDYILKRDNVLKEKLDAITDLGETNVKGQWESDDPTDYKLKHDNILKEQLSAITDRNLDDSLQGKLVRKNHKQYRHQIAGEFQYKCIVCGKEFKVTGDFNKHLRVHSGEKPYECTICGKRCTQNGNLKSHMRSHSGEKPYQCNICGKRFTQNGTLTTHLRIHSGEKPYECALCGKGFPRNEHLKLHMRIHTGEKPYVCHVCNRGFTTNGNLLRHVKVHSGDSGKRQREDLSMQHDTSRLDESFEDYIDGEKYDITEPIIEIVVREERIEGLREETVSDTDD